MKIPRFLWNELSASQRNEIALTRSLQRMDRLRRLEAPEPVEETGWVMRDFGLLQDDRV